MSKLSRKKKASATPTALAPRDKAMLIGVPILLLAIPALVLHFSSIHQQTTSISKTVTKWKTTYHINDEQAERIKQIELDFHGNGSPFSIKPARTRDEKDRHQVEISRLMSPEEGARFIKMMEAGNERH
jgi:hypothetical protein